VDSLAARLRCSGSLLRFHVPSPGRMASLVHDEHAVDSRAVLMQCAGEQLSRPIAGTVWPPMVRCCMHVLLHQVPIDAASSL
jgi:hypothetical protein